jgi:putative transposase
MVAAVRRGGSMRAVAKRFRVRLRTVQYWLKRAGDQRLDRIDWENRPRGCHSSARRTSEAVEQQVLSTRKFLREKSDLGECGPQAIRDEMLRRRGKNVPSSRTIARILGRHGVLDGKRRQRRSPPPRGWFLSAVAAHRAELDSFDIIEDLVIEGGADVNILTGISTHGGLCAAWPRRQITAKITVESLLEHWREFGLPGYAKFDNDTVFQGAHQHPDAFGRVTRLCLSLGVTPVFAPPRETGFQAEIEAFNGRWQKGVWQRFHFTRLQGVQSQSRKYVAANHQKNSLRIADAPRRRAIPHAWKLDLQRPLSGKVIFLRRTDAKGRVSLLGHTYLADENWVSRLVRAEVDLTQGKILLFALRRREPSIHRFLRSHDYKTPQKKFVE